jgi:hypothetical protein
MHTKKRLNHTPVCTHSSHKEGIGLQELLTSYRNLSLKASVVRLRAGLLLLLLGVAAVLEGLLLLLLALALAGALPYTTPSRQHALSGMSRCL